MSGGRLGWTVVIPVRPHGKSRLGVAGAERSRLARAIALDTIEAASRVAAVRVVSSDPTLALPGTVVVTEARPRGIAAAVARGLDGVEGCRAVLLGDLPGLDPADLTAALEAAEHVPLGAVADVEQTGTTLVTARSGVSLVPRFGPDSWDRHRAAGFRPLPVPVDSTLRRDVDLAEHLAGPLGPRTTAVLASRVSP